MHLLDTDTLTHLYVNHPGVVARLRSTAVPVVAVTIISKIEMLQGRFDFFLKAATDKDLLRAQELLTRTEQFLEPLVTIGVGQMAATLFYQLRSTKGLKELERPDLLIACIALAHKATLVTRNLRHFQRIPHLNLTNWVD
jgi:tRNA(fMet)-specific endonuclease VapC